MESHEPFTKASSDDVSEDEVCGAHHDVHRLRDSEVERNVVEDAHRKEQHRLKEVLPQRNCPRGENRKPALRIPRDKHTLWQ